MKKIYVRINQTKKGFPLQLPENITTSDLSNSCLEWAIIKHEQFAEHEKQNLILIHQGSPLNLQDQQSQVITLRAGSIVHIVDKRLIQEPQISLTLKYSPSELLQSPQAECGQFRTVHLSDIPSNCIIEYTLQQFGIPFLFDEVSVIYCGRVVQIVNYFSEELIEDGSELTIIRRLKQPNEEDFQEEEQFQKTEQNGGISCDPKDDQHNRQQEQNSNNPPLKKEALRHLMISSNQESEEIELKERVLLIQSTKVQQEADRKGLNMPYKPNISFKEAHKMLSSSSIQAEGQEQHQSVPEPEHDHPPNTNTSNQQKEQIPTTEEIEAEGQNKSKTK